MTFNVGDRVRLPADELEGWPEEFGEVIQRQVDYQNMYIVQVDPEFREEGDDGIREVHADGITIDENGASFVKI